MDKFWKFTANLIGLIALFMLVWWLVAVFGGTF